MPILTTTERILVEDGLLSGPASVRNAMTRNGVTAIPPTPARRVAIRDTTTVTVHVGGGTIAGSAAPLPTVARRDDAPMVAVLVGVTVLMVTLGWMLLLVGAAIALVRWLT